ncbi:MULTISPECIES: hypothetical protein [Acinetobacter]|jgi:hypothetical protein|uniref:hypothetical protein n=1 Tax=Acinetobacter TaxID=469 RepID=UPI00057500AD|nr:MULTISPECIES: hypothetical protein [Acinetobacter]ATZ63014.1 hypothetical protein BSR55_06515 [Acinetobacter bereziniae]MBI0395268.1 hypothetical protein [Acinetobacter bereziniae]MBJ8552735.1 hypothetical protein [Acinetobacter bereziniae]MBJ9370946.1 hypothetical protein [Acinetobacter sp. TGL-Y2]MCU4416414.1 hypothetical protein [Acinetobacter bereziniae]
MSFKSFSQNTTQANAGTKKDDEQTPSKDVPKPSTGVTPPHPDQEVKEIKEVKTNEPQISK